MLIINLLLWKNAIQFCSNTIKSFQTQWEPPDLQQELPNLLKTKVFFFHDGISYRYGSNAVHGILYFWEKDNIKFSPQNNIRGYGLGKTSFLSPECLTLIWFWRVVALMNPSFRHISHWKIDQSNVRSAKMKKSIS